MKILETVRQNIINFFKKNKKDKTEHSVHVYISELTWTTSDGRILLIREMETNHLISTKKWMERQARQVKDVLFGDGCHALKKHPQYLAILQELKTRGYL